MPTLDQYLKEINWSKLSPGEIRSQQQIYSSMQAIWLCLVDKTQKLRIKLTWKMEKPDAFFGWARYDILSHEIHVSDSSTHSLSTQDDMLILSNGMAWHLSWQSSHRLTILICEERPIKRFYCTLNRMLSKSIWEWSRNQENISNYINTLTEVVRSSLMPSCMCSTLP